LSFCRSANASTDTTRSAYAIDDITIARLQDDMSAGRLSSEELQGELQYVLAQDCAH
jgi:hypothetical protein